MDSQNIFAWPSIFDTPRYQPYAERLVPLLTENCSAKRHGDLFKWMTCLEGLPDAKPSIIKLNNSSIIIGQQHDLPDTQHQQLIKQLKALIPWRKGPFTFFGTLVDSEWRSDFKWQRLLPHMQSLDNKRVLDIGCGTGYHCWRMRGAGAKEVLGIDPSVRFYIQFLCAQKYIVDEAVNFLPLGIEDLAQGFAQFDTVFSMGILYHRKSPQNHLQELYKLLADNGELVLETLIVDNAENGIFRPPDRYAMMRNVWSLMTVEKIKQDLSVAGFSAIRCVDIKQTDFSEQRQTSWMQFHSLKQFLDPQNLNLTIEGHPAPKRALFIAQKESLE